MINQIYSCKAIISSSRHVTEFSPTEVESLIINRIVFPASLCYLNCFYEGHEFWIKSFYSNDLFLYPLKNRKPEVTRGFLMFSGGVERGQWYIMV